MKTHFFRKVLHKLTLTMLSDPVYSIDNLLTYEFYVDKDSTSQFYHDYYGNNGPDAKSLLFRAKAHWFYDDKTKAKKDFVLAEEMDIDLVFDYFNDPKEESWMASVTNAS